MQKMVKRVTRLRPILSPDQCLPKMPHPIIEEVPSRRNQNIPSAQLSVACPGLVWLLGSLPRACEDGPWLHRGWEAASFMPVRCKAASPTQGLTPACGRHGPIGHVGCRNVSSSGSPSAVRV
jgi:hypothetical protein